MQLGWLARGLRKGIVTTRYPARPEPQPAEWRGRPVLDPQRCTAGEGCDACTRVCVSEALRSDDVSFELDYGRCIMCGLCVRACPQGALTMAPHYELAVLDRTDLRIQLKWEPPYDN